MMVPILNTLLSSTQLYVDAQSNLFPTIFNHTYVYTHTYIYNTYTHTHKMFKVIMSQRHVLLLMFLISFKIFYKVHVLFLEKCPTNVIFLNA